MDYFATLDPKAHGWVSYYAKRFPLPPDLETVTFEGNMGRGGRGDCTKAPDFITRAFPTTPWPIGHVWQREGGWVLGFLSNCYTATTGELLGYGPPFQHMLGSRRLKYRRPFYFYNAAVLVSPFTITTDTKLRVHAAVDFGNLDEWAPVEPLRAGSASPAMVALMNRWRHKPSFIVQDGRLYVMVNYHYWFMVEHPDYGSDANLDCLDNELECELAAFYTAAWNQLQTELPGATGMRLG